MEGKTALNTRFAWRKPKLKFDSNSTFYSWYHKKEEINILLLATEQVHVHKCLVNANFKTTPSVSTILVKCSKYLYYSIELIEQ